MTNLPAQTIDLRDALDKHLNARQVSKSISTLLQNKRKTIDYSPDYQRNYVWRSDKATFFIESILLGIEIPPLILFISTSDKKKLEIIDGRQRFETLKRFFEGEFKLNKKGLRSLSGLQGLTFVQLEPEIQRVFLDTTIRTIEFSTIGEHTAQNELEEQIKKEIFGRYNSGITPLKTQEVQRAKHLDDDFTEVLSIEFAAKPQWLTQFKRVFFTRASGKLPTDSECQAKIRELLVLTYFPINIYINNATDRRDTVEWLYELYIESSDDQKDILQTFIAKIEILDQCFSALGEKQWLIYQGVYWAMVVLAQSGIDINAFFNQQVIDKLVVVIRQNMIIFTGDERGLANITYQRFCYLAEFFTQAVIENKEGLVDFSPYLKSRLTQPKHQQPVGDVKASISQLNSMRLNRPDAVTKTIEDLADDMTRGSFLIRPGYQRQEVINIKKASGIIESMLLGIPLPTIFVFRRKDGICEVVDGQQRLLSILAFMGKSFTNEHNQPEWSKKNHYRLFKHINVLKDLAGKKYEELLEDWQERLLDFELSVVYIDEKVNESFDPIDLFIRLNNKPYPVKDHSFEMWNSYADSRFIEAIKTIEKSCRDWFHYRKDSIRMENEELLTVFAFLSYEIRNSRISAFEIVDVYRWAPRPLTFRLPKMLITEWLLTMVRQPYHQVSDEVLSCIDEVAHFIHKVEVLSRSLQLSGEANEASNAGLQQSFNSLLGVKRTARVQMPFYILWFLLLGVDKQAIDQQAAVIAQGVTSFFADKQTVDKDEDEKRSPKDIFSANVEAFWAKYNTL